MPGFGHGMFPQKRYLAFLRPRRPGLPRILERLPCDHIPSAILPIGKVLRVS